MAAEAFDGELPQTNSAQARVLSSCCTSEAKLNCADKLTAYKRTEPFNGDSASCQFNDDLLCHRCSHRQVVSVGEGEYHRVHPNSCSLLCGKTVELATDGAFITANQ